MATERRQASSNFTPANIGNPGTTLPMIFLPSTGHDLYTYLSGDHLHNKPSTHSHHRPSSHSYNRPSAHSLHYKATKRLSVESCPHQVLKNCLSTGKIVVQGELVQCLVNECHDYSSKLHGGPHAAAACGVHCWNEASLGTCSVAEMTTCESLCSLGTCECSCRDPFCAASCQGPTCKEQDLELCDEFFNCSSSCSCSCKGHNCSVSCADCRAEDEADCESRCGVPCTCACSNGQCTPTCPLPYQCQNAGDCEAQCLEPCKCACTGTACSYSCGNPKPPTCDETTLGFCSARCSQHCHCDCQGEQCLSVCGGTSSCDNPVKDTCLQQCPNKKDPCECFCAEGQCSIRCADCTEPCDRSPSTACLCRLATKAHLSGYLCECPQYQYCRCTDLGIDCKCTTSDKCSLDALFQCSKTCTNGLPCVCNKVTAECQLDFCSLLDKQPCIDHCGEACQCLCSFTGTNCKYGCVTKFP
eukprot:GHVT01080483.1.p1 GENE.GHVT01080483.1~~GHVT01080483.1.p1  ORF type:complete len:471 (-),score=1.41 GHVT01080483.1:589-2001(-)